MTINFLNARYMNYFFSYQCFGLFQVLKNQKYQYLSTLYITCKIS
jgi:hypothetical protein